MLLDRYFTSVYKGEIVGGYPRAPGKGASPPAPPFPNGLAHLVIVSGKSRCPFLYSRERLGNTLQRLPLGIDTEQDLDKACSSHQQSAKEISIEDIHRFP